mmetsp:Transcript_58406/g.137120  ORF Transcript_58406/g.137120 Transcript_58406/m.137120 type:complete len:261 (+) Transcript_58406:118-900(+)
MGMAWACIGMPPMPGIIPGIIPGIMPGWPYMTGAIIGCMLCWVLGACAAGFMLGACAGFMGVSCTSRVAGGFASSTFFSSKFNAGAGASDRFSVCARNIDPTPGSHSSGTRNAEIVASHPRSMNPGRVPILRMKFPPSAPQLPPAPTIPATPPTAVGSTYGTTANTAPSVIARNSAHVPSAPSAPPNPPLSLVTLENTSMKQPMSSVQMKRAQRRPRTPHRSLNLSDIQPPSERANRLKSPKSEPARPPSPCERSKACEK